MHAFISTIASNILKYLISSSEPESRVLHEVSENIMKTIALILVSSILGTSMILVCCLGGAYYLFEQGFSV